MMDHIQRAIGLGIGVIVSLVLLRLMADVAAQDALTPLVIGAIAAWFWPVVIAFWLARRVRQRQQDRVESEVRRQMDQQNRN